MLGKARRGERETTEKGLNMKTNTITKKSSAVHRINRGMLMLRGLGMALFLGMTLASHAQSSFATSISRAANLAWPTTDGGMYQVQTSSNFTTWSPSGPIVVGTGQ